MAAPKEEKQDVHECVMSGYLEKQSLHLKQFRKRWIELKQKCLFLYKTKNDKKPTEKIDLKLFEYISIELDGNLFDNQCLFLLMSNDEKTKRIFKAESSEDANRWIKCIKNECKLKEIIKNQYRYKNKTDIIKINIDIVDSYQFNDKLIIYSCYSKEEIINNIFTKINKYLNKRYYPIQLKIDRIDDGFIGSDIYYDEIESIGHDPIINYEKNHIQNKGLILEVKVEYQHKIKSDGISCPFMNKIKSNDPLHCRIYYDMKEKYEFNVENLNHVKQYTHFMDEYGSKPKCKYNDECKAFIRMENGGNKIDDKCHIFLFRHPPRARNQKLSQNIHSFIINKSNQENHPLYQPTDDDKKEYNFKQSDGYLYALIDEVEKNGLKNDLCLECAANDECKHNDYSILQIVDEKMKHIRHKSMNNPLRRDHMLSLVLYTGCDCNYDLCQSQRNGDYTKWKWFDYCLYNAIKILSLIETGSFSVYSGLNGVQLESRSISSGYFVTYTSTSWNKGVAETFMKDNGMIIQIDKEFKNGSWIRCCDVSWISKFPDESEILFARSLSSLNNFKLSILDSSGGIQTVSLTKNESTFKFLK